MQDITGQERVANWLKTAYEQGRLGHAYLFTGSTSDQMKRMAVELAKTINCEQGGSDACGHCSTCIQIEHGNHPDVMSISPDGTYIKIEQVRTVQAAFRYKAQLGITRVLVIEDAERMRMETANSILKFLEEPISPMVAVLLTEKREKILPTVRSRCGWVRFGDRSVELLAEEYQKKGYTAPIARLLAHLSSAEELIELSSDEMEQFIVQLVEWSSNILEGGEDALLHMYVGFLAKKIAENRAKSIVEVLLLLWRELVTGDDHLFSLWRKVNQNFHLDRVFLAIENALIAGRLLQKTELSTQGILEHMVLSILEGKLSKENDWRMIVI